MSQDFVLVGGKAGYKSASMFFEAMQKLPSQHGFKVLSTGASTRASFKGFKQGARS